MAGKEEEYWIIGIKNDGEALPGDDSQSVATFKKLSSSSALTQLASVNRFEIPELRVGTLEKLMTAGDLLVKVDANVENTVRRIEKQFEDLKSKTENSPLGVDGSPPASYVENFRWNAAKYPAQRAVDELIRNIVTSTTKMDAELRDNQAYVTEKKQKANSLQKASEANFVSADLGTVLAPLVKPEDFHDSTYLKTCVIVVNKSKENNFRENYEQIGSDMVGYGPEDDREARKGSPVVPGSVKKVAEDKDYCILLVTILKKFYEQFKLAAQTLDGTVRDFNFEESYEAYQRMMLEDDNTSALDVATRELQEAHQNLRNWCITHYGEAFAAWVHIKAIRVFVESVLRYGLPVNFAAAVIKPIKSGSHDAVRKVLQKTYAQLDSTGHMSMAADETSLKGLDEVFPYVSYTIIPEIQHSK